MSNRYAIFQLDKSGRWVDSGMTLERPIWTGAHESLLNLNAPAERCWREGKSGKWGLSRRASKGASDEACRHSRVIWARWYYVMSNDYFYSDEGKVAYIPALSFVWRDHAAKLLDRTSIDEAKRVLGETHTGHPRVIRVTVYRVKRTKARNK